MINASFHLAIYTFLFFSLGMYNPKWALFFLKKATRFTVAIITTISIMVTLTLFGEGKRQERLEAEATERLAKNLVNRSAPVPVVPQVQTPPTAANTTVPATPSAPQTTPNPVQ